MSDKKDQVKTDKNPKDDVKGTTKEPEKNPTDSKKDQATSKIEEENERLKGTVSSLQKKLNDLERFQQGLKEVIAPTDSGDKELQTQDLIQEVKNLRNEIQAKEKQAQKDSYIDSLEISENRKRYLKTRISADVEDLEGAVTGEITALDEVIANEVENHKAPDRRPVSQGLTRLPESTSDASLILNNKEEWKKQHGLA